MRYFQIKPYFYLVGAVLLFFIILMSWLWSGRSSLFQTSSYMSLYGLSREHLYQGHVLLLTSDSKVKQSFVSKYPGLYKISVLLTSQGKLQQDVGLVFHLRENCDAQYDLRQAETSISASDFDGDMFYAFTFEPLDDSIDREFCFILNANLAQNNNKSTLGARASSLDVYSEGKAFYETPSTETEAISTVEPTANPQYEHEVFLPIIQQSGQLDTDVEFQLYYNGRPPETISVFIRRLTNHKPYFFNSPGFYAFLVVIYLSGVFLLIRAVLAKNLRDN